MCARCALVVKLQVPGRSWQSMRWINSGCVLTSKEKWDELKGILKKWPAHLKAGETDLLHKELLFRQGFLVYVTRNYSPLVPYLKGFNLGIEMWIIDLGKDAVERHPLLLEWIRSLTEQDELRPLNLEGWYEEGYGITGGYNGNHGV